MTPYQRSRFFGVGGDECHKSSTMTIPEIAAQLRAAFGKSVATDKGVSLPDRNLFAAAQNACSDEEIILMWLSVSSVQEHQVPMFVVEQWARRANDLNEWMELLKQNTTPPENN